jgi:hypothetical protein
LLEEDSARLLAHVLWRARRPEAKTAFLAFLAIDSRDDHDHVDDEIEQGMREGHIDVPYRGTAVNRRSSSGPRSRCRRSTNPCAGACRASGSIPTSRSR